eukprot:PhM_4_TR16730/c0_g1_i1/m.30419
MPPLFLLVVCVFQLIVVPTAASETSCDFSRTSYRDDVFPGVCSLLSLTMDPPNPHDRIEYVAPFFPSYSFLLKSSGVKAGSFHLKVEPALCDIMKFTGKLPAETPLQVSAINQTDVIITGDESVEKYTSLIETINVPVCRNVDTVGAFDVFTLQWTFEPATSVAGLVKASTPSPPRYYLVSSSSMTWSEAVTFCSHNDRMLLGSLRGYLATADSTTELELFKSFLSTSSSDDNTVWLGGTQRDGATDTTWVWRQGPDDGKEIPTSLLEKNTDTNKRVAFSVHQTGGGTLVLTSDDGTAKKRAVCEFGGTMNENSAGESLRGVVQLDVRALGCKFSANANSSTRSYNYPGTCHMLATNQPFGAHRRRRALFSATEIPNILSKYSLQR